MEYIYTILTLAFYQAENTAYMQSNSFPNMCRITFKQLFLSLDVQVISDTYDTSNFHLGGYFHFHITVFHQNMQGFQLTLNILSTYSFF